jgi:hypothetical protein
MIPDGLSHYLPTIEYLSSFWRFTWMELAPFLEQLLFRLFTAGIGLGRFYRANAGALRFTLAGANTLGALVRINNVS